MGGPGLPNVGLSAAECRLVQRFQPPLCQDDAAVAGKRPISTCKEALDVIGFFIAKFCKRAPPMIACMAATPRALD